MLLAWIRVVSDCSVVYRCRGRVCSVPVVCNRESCHVSWLVMLLFAVGSECTSVIT